MWPFAVGNSDAGLISPHVLHLPGPFFVRHPIRLYTYWIGIDPFNDDNSSANDGHAGIS